MEKSPTMKPAPVEEVADNINLINVEELNTPEIAAKLDNNPTLKEKYLNRTKYFAKIALGLGVAIASAATVEDMGATTSGAEILSYLTLTTGGIIIFIKGIYDFNLELPTS